MDFQESIKGIHDDLSNGCIEEDRARELLCDLLGVDRGHPWLKKDDRDFAIALQEEDRLEAVKWLREKAVGYSPTPLKTAKEILDFYHYSKK